ncbi:MAG: hypothetical protein NTW28_10295 [Candidatus Solibacter sp.]|nr:hypothetical protein [Candidatus Solibacter sp.]
MKAAIPIPRSVVLVALAAVLASSGLATDRKARVFKARFEAVWAAATDAAKEGFLLDNRTTPSRKRARYGSALARYEDTVSKSSSLTKEPEGHELSWNCGPTFAELRRMPGATVIDT